MGLPSMYAAIHATVSGFWRSHRIGDRAKVK